MRGNEGLLHDLIHDNNSAEITEEVPNHSIKVVLFIHFKLNIFEFGLFFSQNNQVEYVTLGSGNL